MGHTIQQRAVKREEVLVVVVPRADEHLGPDGQRKPHRQQSHVMHEKIDEQIEQEERHDAADGSDVFRMAKPGFHGRSGGGTGRKTRNRGDINVDAPWPNATGGVICRLQREGLFCE